VVPFFLPSFSVGLARRSVRSAIPEGPGAVSIEMFIVMAARTLKETKKSGLRQYKHSVNVLHTSKQKHYDFRKVTLLSQSLCGTVPKTSHQGQRQKSGRLWGVKG
jgi:hypothetical protein